MSEPRKPAKQAVIVVHGMGEQRPMETLRGFVSGLFSLEAPTETAMPKTVRGIMKSAADALMPSAGEDGAFDKYWIVPDARTGSSELSRIRSKPMPISTGELETDFYELYYSDLLSGNTLQHLWSWFRGLLLRWPHQVPKSQACLWVLLWVATVLVSLLVGSELADAPLKRLQDSWAKASNVRNNWTIALSVVGAIILMWLMSSAYRRHVDSSNTRPASGVVDPIVSAALCVALPALLGVWAYFKLPWTFFSMPCALIDQMRESSFFCKIYLLITGWSALKMALAALITFVITKMGVPVFGDVPRYLRTAPDGVAARSQIRERGLKLLETIHDAKVLAPGAKGDPAEIEYGRVVIAAHSLGSIVAYDVLRLFWAKRGANGGKPLSPKALAALKEVDQFCRAHPDAPKTRQNWPLDKYVALQDKAAAAIAAQVEGWRVTDFITLGSPLAHAEFLLTRDRPRFERLVNERVYPTSPPQLDTRMDDGGKKSLFYRSNVDGREWPHHAAMFATVRWTAIYDPKRFIFVGDFFGGEMRRNFGQGIAEARTRLFKPGLLRRIVTHTHYWNPKADSEILNAAELPADIRPDTKNKPHLALLRKIIFRSPIKPE